MEDQKEHLEKVFQELKEHKLYVNSKKSELMSSPLLVLPDLTKTFEVHCDASGDSLGVILSQEGHPIAYDSCHFATTRTITGYL